MESLIAVYRNFPSDDGDSSSYLGLSDHVPHEDHDNSLATINAHAAESRAARTATLAARRRAAGRLTPQERFQLRHEERLGHETSPASRTDSTTGFEPSISESEQQVLDRTAARLRCRLFDHYKQSLREYSGSISLAIQSVAS